MRLGIDFGTCYSSAALFLDNRVRAIKDPINLGYSFPSSVFLTPQGEMLVGYAAENNRQQNLDYYQREFKRYLGSDIPCYLGDTTRKPEELVTEVIKKLKIEADKVVIGLGESPLTQAILTVPATYLSNKRQLMLQACDRAGFSQVQLLEEPVAAGIYYSQVAKVGEGEIILVYDLGGGTFDATLIQKQASDYQLLGMPDGLSDCGGADFDRLIFQELLKNCSPDLREKLQSPESKKYQERITPECLKLKHQLSEALEGTIWTPTAEVESFSLTRERFNEMIDGLVGETLECCDRLLVNTNLKWSQIDRVLLVGGSCRIPYVKDAVAQKWGKTPIQVDDPELAVCFGAAIYGASLLGKQREVQDRQQPEIEPQLEAEFTSKQKPPIKSQLEEESRNIQQPEIDRQHQLEEFYEQGLVCHKQKDYDQAITYYQRVLELNPHHIDCLLNLGVVFKTQGKLEKAIACYQQAVQIDPNRAKAHYNLANALKSQGKLDQAISEYRQAIVLDSNHPQLHCNLGLALQAQGILEEAIAEYQTALKIDPNHAIAHHALGIAWYSQGKYAEAIAEYQAALKIDPHRADTHCNLAMALQVQRKYVEAIAEYQTALQIAPNHTDARSNLKILESELQKRQKTDQDSQSSDRSNSNTKLNIEQVFQQGLANLQQENYSAAKDNFGKIIETIPNSKIAYLYRGLAYFYLDNYQKIIEDCQQVIQLDPKYADAYICLGFALFCSGKNREAIKAFNHALQINKHLPGAYLGRSLTHVSLNQHQRAIADLTQFRKITDDFNINEYNQILTEFVRGNKQEVINYLKKISKLFILKENPKQHSSEVFVEQNNSSKSNNQKISENYQTTQDYLAQIIRQFQAQAFQCNQNINFHNYTFACVAEGRKTIALVQPLKTFFVFAEFDYLNIAELRQFTRESFNYCGAKRKQELIKLPGFLCYPVAVVKNIEPSTLEALRQELPNFETSVWANSYAFPIILDLTSMKLYFSEQRPFFGWAVWPSIRKIAQEMLI